MNILVDDEDKHLLEGVKWFLDKNGYCVRSTKSNGKNYNYKLHRLVMNLTDRSLIVDHINGNKLDNRKSNLRVVTTSENNYNKRPYNNAQVPYKGVTKCRDVFMGRICYNGKRISKSGFTTAEEAARWYDEQAKKLFGNYAYINGV